MSIGAAERTETIVKRQAPQSRLVTTLQLIDFARNGEELRPDSDCRSTILWVHYSKARVALEVPRAQQIAQALQQGRIVDEIRPIHLGDKSSLSVEVRWKREEIDPDLASIHRPVHLSALDLELVKELRLVDELKHAGQRIGERILLCLLLLRLVANAVHLRKLCELLRGKEGHGNWNTSLSERRTFNFIY